MRRKIGACIVCIMILSVGILLLNKGKNMHHVNVVEMKEYDKLAIGRACIGIFGSYKVLGVFAIFNDLSLKGDGAMSESSFNKWIDNRWNIIKYEDEKNKVEIPPVITRKPHAVSFKYDYHETKLPNDSFYSSKGEGAVWLNNQALFIAPEGGYEAYNKILKIIDNVTENRKTNNNKGFCLDFYCIDAPVSQMEHAGLNVSIIQYKGLRLSIDTETYTAEQNKYPSQRDGESRAVIPNELIKKYNTGYEQYSRNKKRVIDNIPGEENIWGISRGINGQYKTTIQAQWYYPGTSNDPYDPEIDITLIYEFEADHKPSNMGWFDDETVKQTGLTDEKFISMWEATLKSFKRNR